MDNSYRPSGTTNPHSYANATARTWRRRWLIWIVALAVGWQILYRPITRVRSD